jgi:hypothetical protein
MEQFATTVAAIGVSWHDASRFPIPGRLMHLSPALTIFAAATLAALSAGCAAGRPATEAVGSSSGNRDAEHVEGFYAICDGAHAHRETLLLRAGAFEHFIHTHGMYGSRSAGSYALIGDTIALRVERTRPAPDGDERPIPPDYDFVTGDIGGHPVLWRGRETARQHASNAGAVSVYAALFHAGSENADRAPPSCDGLRSRAGAGAAAVGSSR